MVRENSGRGIWHPEQGFGMQSPMGIGASAPLLLGVAAGIPGRVITPKEALNLPFLGLIGS